MSSFRTRPDPMKSTAPRCTPLATSTIPQRASTRGRVTRAEPPGNHPQASGRPRPRVIVAVALLLAFVGGCGEARTRPEEAEGPIVVDPSEVHLVATSDAIATVRDLEVLPDGTIWVLNSVEPFFLGFSPDGTLLYEHGSTGGGPREFGRPAGFVLGGIDDQAWLFDWQRHLLVEVSRPDSARRELALPADSIPPTSVLVGMNLLSTVVRTARLGDEIVVPRRWEAAGEDAYGYWLSSWHADLVGWKPETGAVRTILSLRDLLGDPTLQLDPGNGLPPFPLWYRLWAVCSEDELRVYDRPGNQLQGFTAEGVELEATPLPPVRYTAVSPREFARAAFDLIVVEGMGVVPPDPSFEMSPADSARVMNQAVQRLTASPEQLAAILPRYVDFRCAPDGTQWLRPFDLERGGLDGGPVWLRISPEGEIDRVRLPDRFDPYRFSETRIWGVQRNQLDVASIAWLPTPAVR